MSHSFDWQAAFIFFNIGILFICRVMADNSDSSPMKFFLKNNKAVECTNTGCTEPIVDHDCNSQLFYFGCVYSSSKYWSDRYCCI